MSIQADNDTLVLPVFVYCDDTEPLNAIGAHSGEYKICGTYLKIPCLPDHLQSLLSFIILAMFHFSDDHKRYGNSRIFGQLIDELNLLQNIGFQINHSMYKRVVLIPALVLGDNLGLNSVLGFVECFRANHYCRLCKCHRNVMEYQLEEDSSMIRTIQNYAHDVSLNDNSLTGIKENSIWNKLDNFHVVLNYSVDIMHDLLEGVCHFVLSQILYQFIHVKKYFSLQFLNARISTHNYGNYYKSHNKPSPISDEMLTKMRFRCTAAEMHTLMINFPLLIGDVIPVDDKLWNLYLLLRQILSIVTSNEVHKDYTNLLKHLISQHHSLYIENFGPLKPKLHFMVHYPRIMAEIGSLRGIWCMRLEAKHSFFKKTAKAITCRINLIQSLCIKHQLHIANILANFETFKNEPLNGPTERLSETSLIEKYKIIENCDNDNLFVTSWVKFKGLKFKPNVVIQSDKQEDEAPLFALINYILCTENGYVFCCQRLTNKGFDFHFHSFEVEYEEQYFSFKLCDPLYLKVGHIHNLIRNMKFINWDVN